MSAHAALGAATALTTGALGLGGFLTALQADHGIPTTHAQVYIEAARAAPCPLDYRVLAAIGAVESGHGTSTARDDSGLVTSYAGAQGDMQVMPDTFAAYATDGNGNGTARVEELEDSVATAAAYLCASNVDENLDDALWNYNHSWSYVADVKARMAAFPPLDQPVRDDAGQAQRIVDAALAWVGRDFRPGVGEQCMFWVRQALADAGVTLTPEVTTRPLDGSWTGVGIANSIGADQGTVITRLADVRAGDIVMFANTYGNWFEGAITHAGIAVSPTEMVDRSTMAAPVRRRPLTTFRNFAGAVRLKGSAAAPPGRPVPEGPTMSQVGDAALRRLLEAGAATCRAMRQDERLAPVCDVAGEAGERFMAE